MTHSSTNPAPLGPNSLASMGLAAWVAEQIGIDLGPVHNTMQAALAGEARADSPDQRAEAIQAGRPDLSRATSSKSEAGTLYAWLRYHHGWEDWEGNAIQDRRAKGFRPLICLIACQGLGGESKRAIPLAAAIEMTHEFSLIHDDIEDGDELRRGRPTLWNRVGIPQAINAGDALFAIARQQIDALTGIVPAESLLRIYRRYDAACLNLAEGQYLDISFENETRVSVERYCTMVEGKTSALLGAAAAMGAETANAKPEIVDSLDRFGRALGIAFQMRDDWLGIWGDPAETGKPAGNDLRRRKRSLPILLALETLPDPSSLQDHLAGQGPADAEQCDALLEEFRLHQVDQKTEAMAQKKADEALAGLSDAGLADREYKVLAGILRYAVERKR